MASLNINDYRYELPASRIALHPLRNRDESKLLVYKKGSIVHTLFPDLTAYLPENTFLFFNDTKVIPARLHFKKETGAAIEIFLLTPVEPSPVIAEAMQSTDKCSWKCVIGNVKKWNKETALKKVIDNTILEARLQDKEEGLVQFSWAPKKTFAEIISMSGETPLPPYIKRKVEESDRERYQTVYSHYEGAVAAPTAGLHFTRNIFRALEEKSIGHDFLTLHVSAGTFQPVKTENVNEHIMHPEQVVITKKNIENLLQHGKFFIAVGTTSMRTLESIYWFGVKLLQDPASIFEIHQDDPYMTHDHPSAEQAIKAVMKHLDDTKQETITGVTSIFIKPGYRFKICKGLITNFHQPASTLMLLVAAFVGDDWKSIYAEALQKDYRFLSYGDSSLLIPGK